MKFRIFTANHRAEFYGICTFIGLILTVYTINRNSESASPPTPIELSSDEPTEEEKNVKYIVESSAHEITLTSQELPNSIYSEEKLEDVFLEKWIRPSGWVGVVLSMPEKMYTEEWMVILTEQGTGTTFSLFSEDDKFSTLRKHDRIQVNQGQIERISRNWDGDASVALHRASFTKLPKLNPVMGWWARNGYIFKDTFTSGWTWLTLLWWILVVSSISPMFRKTQKD